MRLFYILMKVLVSIEILVMSVKGVISMSRQLFSMLVGMRFKSHDFDDEPNISFLISSSVARSKTNTLNLISSFCVDGIFITLSGNLKRIVSISSTKYLEKLSQSDFTDVNSGRASDRILCRILVVEFHSVKLKGTGPD